MKIINYETFEKMAFKEKIDFILIVKIILEYAVKNIFV